MNNTTNLEQFAPQTFRFYRHALDLLTTAEIPFLVGGAYAFTSYTGIVRHTKDFDIFIRRCHLEPIMEVFARARYRVEVVFSHWLAKAYHATDFVDIIFSSGNGICQVDDACFEHAVRGEVLGLNVLLMPAEDMIWQKAFIMERERFDGADVIHLLRARGPKLDWEKLVARFGPHWRVLLSHLILFGFVYPDDRDTIPRGLLHSLLVRLQEDAAPNGHGGFCQGPLLSRIQYLPDTEKWGYGDPRVVPQGPLTQEQAEYWTDAGR